MVMSLEIVLSQFGVRNKYSSRFGKNDIVAKLRKRAPY